MNEGIIWVTTNLPRNNKSYDSKNYFWHLMYPKSLHSIGRTEAIELKYQLGELTEKLFEI